MLPTPIIPVLDLMIGQIVLATGGQRDHYQPVVSKLTRSSQPLEVANAIQQQTGCDLLYLADIDSFAGAEPNWNVYNGLLNQGFGLWVDANWLHKDRFAMIGEKIKQPERLQVIVSTETMQSVEQFQILQQLIAAGVKPIFSLDKQDATVITQPGELSQTSPLELIQHAVGQGVGELIVLDLAGVGTQRGLTEDNGLRVLFQEIRDELPDVQLTSGGGVRTADDAAEFIAAGCQHVLVASAIHECRFTRDDVARLADIDLV